VGVVDGVLVFRENEGLSGILCMMMHWLLGELMHVRIMFVGALHKSHRQSPQQSSSKMQKDLLRRNSMHWRIDREVISKEQAFGLCKSCKKMLFGMWSRQQ
jgi:hypothetical protein